MHVAAVASLAFDERVVDRNDVPAVADAANIASPATAGSVTHAAGVDAAFAVVVAGNDSAKHFLARKREQLRPPVVARAAMPAVGGVAPPAYEHERRDRP